MRGLDLYWINFYRSGEPARKPLIRLLWFMRTGLIRLNAAQTVICYINNLAFGLQAEIPDCTR